MTDPASKAEIIEEARLLLGIPRPNADVLVALLCAWDMGYRSPRPLSEMASTMLDPVSGSGDGK